jgi:two-component system, NarL family, invasion response regulator UvrY
MMTKVLIIDDHPIVLQGCRRMLENAGVTDVIEAADAASGYRLFSGKRPQVVIIDLGLHDSGLGGLELIRRIRADDMNVRILVFSMHSDPVVVARALQAGATGYVVKDTSPERFIEAFKKVRAGTRYLSDDLALQVAFANTPSAQDPLAGLTPRELQTLSLLAEGKSYNRIADDLNLSYKTVVNISSQLKQKLNADNLPDLIRIAVQLLSTVQQLPSKHKPP